MVIWKTKITDDKKDLTGGYLDLTQFIRSIQRIEGNSDCFARMTTKCDSSDCHWHSYCLKELKKQREKEKIKNGQWNSKMV